MEIPPKDNRKTSESKARNSTPKMKTSKRRTVLTRFVIPISLVLLCLSLLTFAVVRFVHMTAASAPVQEKPISDVLNMAAHGQIKAVTLNGNDVYATGKNGAQYH